MSIYRGYVVRGNFVFSPINKQSKYKKIKKKIGIYSTSPPYLSVLNLFPIYKYLDHSTEFYVGRIIWVAPNRRTCSGMCLRLLFPGSDLSVNCKCKIGRTTHGEWGAHGLAALLHTPIVKLCYLSQKDRAKDLLILDASWSIPNFPELVCFCRSAESAKAEVGYRDLRGEYGKQLVFCSYVGGK